MMKILPGVSAKSQVHTDSAHDSQSTTHEFVVWTRIAQELVKTSRDDRRADNESRNTEAREARNCRHRESGYCENDRASRRHRHRHSREPGDVLLHVSFRESCKVKAQNVRASQYDDRCHEANGSIDNGQATRVVR